MANDPLPLEVTANAQAVKDALDIQAADVAGLDDYAKLGEANSFTAEMGFQQGINDGTGNGGQVFIPEAAGTLDLEPVVVSASRTAVKGAVYHNVASATYTDPSPVEGKGFDVLVINGTATVGGTGYSTAGTLVKRRYHSGSWRQYSYLPTP